MSSSRRCSSSLILSHPLSAVDHRLLHGCPTGSVPIEVWSALGRAFFSILWLNSFNGLRNVVRGAAENEKKLMGYHEALSEEYLTRAQNLQSGEDPEKSGHLQLGNTKRANLNMFRSMSETLSAASRTKIEVEILWLTESTDNTVAALITHHPKRKEVMQRLRENLTPRERMSLLNVGITELKMVYEKFANDQKTKPFAEAMKDAKRRAYHDYLKEQVVSAFSVPYDRKLIEGEQAAREQLLVGDSDLTTLYQCDTGPFSELAFDMGEDAGGLVRVRMSPTRLSRLRRMAYIVMFIGLVMTVSILWLGFGTYQLLTAEFDTTGEFINSPAVMLADEIFFPSIDCDASGPGGLYNRIIAVFMLVVWTPANCVGIVCFSAWVISLLLAAALTRDDVEDLMQALDPRNVEKYFESDVDVDAGDDIKDNLVKRERVAKLMWRTHVQLPAAMLVTTMEHLSQWGVTMATAIGSCFAFSVGLLPMAVAKDSFVAVVVLVTVGTLLPGTMLCESLRRRDLSLETPAKLSASGS
eukprot:COSAG02_NODE_7044_length_3213_cov_1.195890_2_plen_526_part_00